MSKEFSFGENVVSKVLKGVGVLNDAVSATLGPKGRLVIIQKRGGTHTVTKDGVTVANSVVLEDPFENLGAQVFREAAQNTASLAGDGTTTSTLLAYNVYSEGVKLMAAGHDPVNLKNGVDWAVEKVVDYLRSTSTKVTSSKEIEQVGTISANGDSTIGKLLAEAMEQVGNDGVISLEEGKGVNTELKVVNGYMFDRGWLSQHFVTNEKLEAVLEKTKILVTDVDLNNAAIMLPIMEKCHALFSGVPLLVIARSVDGEALALSVINKIKGSFKSCCVKAPGFGDRQKEMLEDIAVLTGATVVSDSVGLKLESFDPSWLGEARRVVVTKNSTTIIEGSGAPEAVEYRVAQIREQVKDCTDDYDKEKQQERLAKLVGGIAIVSVGGVTEAAMKERFARVEDSLAATKSAVQEGINVGGGVALLRASEHLKTLTPPQGLEYGVGIVVNACTAPLKRIVENAGGKSDVIAMKVLESTSPTYGYNAQTGTFEDLLESGVIDPTRVIRCSLENAASVSGLMLLTECMITDKPEPKKEG